MAKEAQVLALRAEGLTYAEIGERLGVTKQRAWQIAKRREREAWWAAFLKTEKSPRSHSEE